MQHEPHEFLSFERRQNFQEIAEALQTGPYRLGGHLILMQAAERAGHLGDPALQVAAPLGQVGRQQLWDTA